LDRELILESDLAPKGAGDITLCYRDGTRKFIPLREENLPFKNAVLNGGRAALVQGIANQFGGIFDNWVYQMAFGSGGTVGGIPRFVEASRTGLWGPVAAVKTVISTINPSVPNQVTFTSVLLFDDAVGSVINEMGLVLKNGDYYSITTFGDIAKSSNLQLIVNWRQTFV